MLRQLNSHVTRRNYFPRFSFVSLAAGIGLLAVPVVFAGGGPGAGCCSKVAQATVAVNPTVIETQLNVFTSSTQENVSFDVDAITGNIVAVWDSKRQEDGSYGVYARLFDSFARPLSPEIHVNDFVKGAQRRPAVAFDERGGVWFAWESTGQDGSGSGIVARRFSADFSDATDEIAVNVKREGAQGQPVVTSDGMGRVAIMWETPSAGDDATGRTELRMRLFGADGKAITGERVVASDAAGGSDHAGTIVFNHETGEYVAVWTRTAGDGNSAKIVSRMFSQDGMMMGDEIAISPAEEGRFFVEPSVAVDGSGRFVVAWMSSEDDNGYSVSVRRFSSDGSFIDKEFQTVASASANWKTATTVAAAEDGRFVVAYNEATVGKNYDEVMARFYGADGTAVAKQAQRVNRITKGRQYLNAVSGARRAYWDSRRDSVIFAWNGGSEGGDSSGANLSILTTRERPAAGEVKPIETRYAAKVVTSDEFLRPNPPIWDPTWVPEEPLVNVQGDGPDFGFEAVQNTGWTPPDPEMAVGLDTIVVMTNGEISTFNKDGSQLWQDEIENSFGFWGGQGADNFVFDPEVLWDPHTQRFMAMASERSNNGRSMFDFAVSKDSRPETASDWWKYRIDVTALSGNDIDSPNMAVDDQFVYLTADFFSPDKYLIFVMDKAPLLSGGAITSNSELIVGAHQQSMGIPVTYDGGAPAQYIIQSTENNNNTKVILHAVQNPLTNYSRVTFDLTVPDYTFPASPPQKGTSSRPFLFEPRFWSCVYRNGSSWAVHHVNSQRTRARWYEIKMNGWPDSGQNPALAQSGEIDPGAGIYTFFPSINVDNLGNAAITFARSATDEFISMSRAVRAAGDTAGTFRDAVFVKDSTAVTTSGRWGDYSFTQADPTTDGVFWGHHEFMVATNNWRTWVAQYVIDPENRLKLVIDPLVAGQSTKMTVENATPGLRAYFTYSLTGLGNTVVPQLNITLEIDSPILAGSAKINSAGFARIVKAVPRGSSGTKVWMQAAENGRRSQVVSDTVQ